MIEQENHSGQVGEARATAAIRGWLLVYLILAVIFDVAAVVLLFTSGSELTSEENELGMLAFLVLSGCAMTGFLVYAFMKRKPYAAFLGKHHVIINAIPAACVFILLFNKVNTDIFALLFVLLLFGGVAIWRNFFGSSSQVKALIPPATRTVGKKEKYLVTFLYVAIGIAIFIHAGWSRWWVTLLGVWGVLSFSPLEDFFNDSAEEPKQDN